MITDTAKLRSPFGRWMDGQRPADSATAPVVARRMPDLASVAARHAGEGRAGPLRVGADAGFTLIELMVVLLILAILLAIAIPTFLGVTKSANDRAAQSNLNTAMVNAKAAYQTNGQTYTGVNTTTLSNAEPSLSYAQATTAGTTGFSPAQGTISMYVSTDGKGLVLAAYSTSSKDCWYQIDNTSGLSSAAQVAPWGASTTANSGTTAAASATAITFAGSQGTIYAEVKGDSTASDCSAGKPVIGVGAYFGSSTTSFPAL
jgi:type IV pilus assembly protein PilA